MIDHNRSSPEELEADSLPLAMGVLLPDELDWYPDPDDPTQEQAQARIKVLDCPYCGEHHYHGWLLIGELYVGTRRSHCRRGAFRLRPFWPGEPGFELHAIDPMKKMVRRWRRRR